jgi:hypothetical protein
VVRLVGASLIVRCQLRIFAYFCTNINPIVAAMKYSNIREEELKSRLAKDWFSDYDCAPILGNVDFAVTLGHSQVLYETESLLWAEAKRGRSDVHKSIVQLILTIGKARTFDKFLPPAFLGAFDAEKIAFIPYNDIQALFYMNDFNWNVTPSKQDTKEFRLIFDKVKDNLSEKALLFDFVKDEKDLKQFIKHNFVSGKIGLTKVQIDKNNFISIYNKWLHSVKPTIAVSWNIVKQTGLIDGDFYLADLLSRENETLKESLFFCCKKNVVN